MNNSSSKESKTIPSVFTTGSVKSSVSEKQSALRGRQRQENHEKGQASEDKAAAYLKKNGYRILERNWRFHKNEIDIIARDGDYLVFVEVKARKNALHGFGCEAVDSKKQGIIKKVAEAYLIYNHLSLTGTPCRFDVISIDGGSICLFKNAF
ncbi:YraN family protein [Oribacterium sp. P6A1]|uniref:YraN family protein n=1 Tax=Oribacterium sp. P6A1 TaxID=1410612 RepID=UPI0009DFAADA|nr:YraN family protein [Oribacterium sp. P6A1]